MQEGAGQGRLGGARADLGGGVAPSHPMATGLGCWQGGEVESLGCWQGGEVEALPPPVVTF